jgi:hypothetical protein
MVNWTMVPGTIVNTAGGALVTELLSAEVTTTE